MYKKTIWHVVLAAYVVFIFSNSLTPADLSSEESGFVMRLVHQAIGRTFGPMADRTRYQEVRPFFRIYASWNSAFPEHEKSGLRRSFQKTAPYAAYIFYPVCGRDITAFHRRTIRSDQRCMAGYERSRDRYNSLCLYLFPDIRES